MPQKQKQPTFGQFPQLEGFAKLPSLSSFDRADADALRKRREAVYKQLERPIPPPETPRWETLSWWEKPLDILQRPSYAVVGAITGALQGKDPIDRAIKGITGEKAYTFMEEIPELRRQPKYIKWPIGLALDIVTDPVTYLTMGTMAGAKLAATGVSKALPATIKLSAQGAKLQRAILDAVVVANKAKKPTVEIADHIGDVMRLLIERPAIAAAKDRSALLAFDNILATKPQVLQTIENLRAMKIIPPVLDYAKMMEKPGLRLSIPGLRKLIGEPRVFGGLERLPVKVAGELAKGTLGLAKRAPLIGGVVELGERAGVSAIKGLKKAFGQTNELPGLTLERQVANAEFNIAMKKALDEIEKKREAILKIIGNDPIRKAEFEKNYRDMMTYLHSTMENVPDEVARTTALKQIRKLEGELGKLERIGKDGTLKHQQRIDEIVEKSGKVFEVESSDPYEIAKAVGFTKLSKKQARLVDKVAAKIAREEQLRLRTLHLEEGAPRLEALWTELDGEIGGIGLPEKASKELRNAYVRLVNMNPRWKVSKDARRLAFKPDELAAWFKDRGENIITGEQALHRLADIEGMRKGRLPIELRGRPKITHRHKIQAAQQIVAEAAEKARFGLEETKKAAEATLLGDKAKLERLLQAEEAAKEAASNLMVPKKRGLTADEIRRGMLADGTPIPHLQAISKEERELAAWSREFFDAYLKRAQELDIPILGREGYLPLMMNPALKGAWINALTELGLEGRGFHRSAGSGVHAMQRFTDYTIDHGSIMDWLKENRLHPQKLLDALKKQGFTAENLHEVRLWIEDPFEIMAQYAKDLERVLARETLRNRILDRFASHTLDPGASDFWEKGNKILAEEEDSTFFVRIKHEKTKEIDWKGYHELRGQATMEEIVKIKDEIVGRKVYVIPREASEEIERAYNITQKDRLWADFTWTFDRVTGLYKASTTSIFPTFHFRNWVSNLFMIHVAGVSNPIAKATRSLFAMRAWTKGTAEKIAPVVSRNGVEMSMKDFIAELERRGAIGTSGWTKEMEAYNSMVQRSKNPAVKAWGGLTEFGNKANDFADNVSRLSVAIDQFEKGADLDSIAEYVRLHLYGPQQLTSFERSVASRLIPFYSWMRFSIPYAVRTITTRPGEVAMIGKAKNDFEADVATLDKSVVPEWLSKQAGIEVKREGKTHYFFTLGGWIPTADILKLSDAPAEIMAALHPGIRIPIELATNINASDHRELERFEGESKRFLGMPIRAKAVQVLRSIRILNEVDRILFRPELSWKEKAAASLVGGRLYPVDEEYAYKRALFAEQRRGSAIKQAINRAEIQLGPRHSEVWRLTHELAESQDKQKVLRQHVLAVNPDAWKRTPKEELVGDVK